MTQETLFARDLANSPVKPSLDPLAYLLPLRVHPKSSRMEVEGEQQ
jgi:hypothetical protein